MPRPRRVVPSPLVLHLNARGSRSGSRSGRGPGPAKAPRPRPDASTGADDRRGAPPPARPGRTGIRRVLRDNGLSLVLVMLFLLCWVGQSVAGHRAFNNEQREHAQPEVGYSAYLGSAHFWEASSENWESEFLQMFFYVMLTALLYQRGSAESKKLDQPEPVDRDPRARRNDPDAPWPVRRGGLVLKLYEHSLSLAFFLFFATSISLHALAGADEYNEDQAAHGEPTAVSALRYALTSRFWFESFQNWQSEFLAIAAMVVFSIFLRQRGSPESKPVDSPHGETGQ
jgi:hypothetical protein